MVDVEVFNFGYVLCMLDEGVDICMEFIVNNGKGYVFVDCN